MVHIQLKEQLSSSLAVIEDQENKKPLNSQNLCHKGQLLRALKFTFIGKLQLPLAIFNMRKGKIINCLCSVLFHLV